MSKTILLIEADEAFASALEGAFAERGAEVKQTADGKEGIRIAEDGVDAIVLCVELPKMSGYAVCNKLKKNDELKQIPLIITSSEATPKTFEQHKKLKTRAEDYVIKPCEPADVVEKVAALVDLGEDDTAELDEDIDLLEDAFDALELDEDGGSSEGTQIIDAAAVNGLGDDELEDVALDALEVSDSQVEEVDTADLAIDSLGSLGDDEPLEVEAAGEDEPALEAVEVEEDDDLVEGLELLGDEDVAAPVEVAAPARSAGGAGAAARIQSLEEENEKLRRERGDLEKRVSEIEDELRAKSNELEAFRAGGGGGGGAKEVLKLKGELTQRDKEILSLKETLHEKEKAALEWQERENELELKAAELEESALTGEAQVKTLGEKIASQAERLDKVQAELEAAHGEARRVGEMQAELEAAAGEQQRLEGQVAELGGRLSTADGKVQELQGQIDSLQAELEQSQSAQEEVAQLQERIDELERENGRNEERVLKAYQKLKGDEKLREKTRKALQVALELLDEVPPAETVDEEDLGPIQIESA